MVRAEFQQDLHVDENEALFVEKMIQGPAHEGVMRVEGAVHAAADAGVEQAADALEETCGVGTRRRR